MVFMKFVKVDQNIPPDNRGQHKSAAAMGTYDLLTFWNSSKILLFPSIHSPASYPGTGRGGSRQVVQTSLYSAANLSSSWGIKGVPRAD